MEGLVDKLRGGDRRSVGRADEVVAEVLADPSRFDEVFAAIGASDALVRMRAADVVEKVSSRRPDLLAGHKDELLHELAEIPQVEVRWHVAQMLPRLPLDGAERRLAVEILTDQLSSSSKIVIAAAMESLAQLCADDPTLRPRVIVLLDELVVQGSPSVRARGRRLLDQLLT